MRPQTRPKTRPKTSPTTHQRDASKTACASDKENGFHSRLSYVWQQSGVAAASAGQTLSAAQALFGTGQALSPKACIRRELAQVIRRLRTTRRQGASRSQFYSLGEHRFLIREMRALTRRLSAQNMQALGKK